ncbi:Hypothetical predicted protein [Podarcis lilfordi]|uniref:Uncharacterized protein n=1 Tax=Podarcis lilfordi TaxID=74358 RepID=A0AA35JR44_9SAUR|nr:Hypothetical predicted protein [Podarcis lilfordi]
MSFIVLCSHSCPCELRVAFIAFSASAEKTFICAIRLHFPLFTLASTQNLLQSLGGCGDCGRREKNVKFCYVSRSPFVQCWIPPQVSHTFIEIHVLNRTSSCAYIHKSISDFHPHCGVLPYSPHSLPSAVIFHWLLILTHPKR